MEFQSRAASIRGRNLRWKSSADQARLAGQLCEDEEEYGEPGDLRTWTRDSLKEYSELNLHANGKEEEMEPSRRPSRRQDEILTLTRSLQDDSGER